MEFEHIIMKCRDENTDYPDPPTMFNKDGTCKFAYVTLVMLGDTYISGAITVAYSARKCGSVADLVVLITPDVSENGKDVLRKFFTHVIEVDYITVPNWRTKSQPHRRYLELVFTKFHLFNLTQYEKVLLIDADAIVLKHPDHLFSLNAPAGSLIPYKDQIITYDKNGNYVYPKDGELKWYKDMCGCCAHGKKIDKSITDKVLTDFKNSGVAAGLWLLEPNANELDRILKDVSQGKSKWLVGNKYVWPEQQYLTGFYSGKWTSINPRFYGLQGYPHWSVLYGIQYAGDKPFVEKSKASITERMKYSDFVLWHQFYKEILTKHPELYSADSLKEANNMNKFFQSSIKGQKRMIENVDKNMSRYKNDKARMFVDYVPKQQVEKNVIAKIFKIESTRIHDAQLKYYHNEIDCDYNNLDTKPMWDDIKNGDYFEPVKRLGDYFSSNGNKNYYSDMMEKYKDLIGNSHIKRLDIVSQPAQIIEQIDKDLIMLEYFKCKPDIFTLTFWPLVLHQLSTIDVIKSLEKYGDVIYTKTLTLSNTALHNLMFLMYDDFTYEARLGFIKKKMEYVQSGDTNEVLVVYLQNTKNIKIAGQSAPVKKEIRNELMKLSGLDKNKEIRGNDVVHINDFFYQTIAYSQILLNENSLKMLQFQNVKNISSSMFNESRLKMQTFKKWCFQNLSALEIERIIIMGGSTLFSLGIRVSNDIDAVFVTIGHEENQSEEELSELLNDNFGKEETKFFFSDVGIENHPVYWKKSWTDKNNIVLNQFDIDSLTELTTNPAHHYYFSGFKLYLIKYEIFRKLQRNRKQDHADFMMLATLYPSLVSEFIRMHDGKLKYDPILASGIKEPKLEHHYLKLLFTMIYQRYPRESIDKFKKLVNLI
jgi:hypothetical protein